MTYVEEINKLRALLQVVAYPRYGTAEWFLTRTDCAERIQAVCELEDIEPLEPNTYYAHGRYATEAEAKEGLDTCGYPGKWSRAKESVASEKPELFTAPAFWDAVRLYFLELGGCWLSERCEHSNEGTRAGRWQAAISQAVATRPAEPFTSVREG